MKQKAAGKSSPITWRTERARLGDLVPWDKNPRILTDKQAADLDESLEEFGLVDALVVNDDGRSMIGGHARRLRLLAKHGPDHVVEVRVPDRHLSPAKRDELGIRLNANTGEWNWEALDADFPAAKLEAWGLELEAVANPPAIPHEDDPAAAEVPRVTEPGDLWHLGRHRVLCGDSFVDKDLKRLTGGQLVDVVLTDPPYAIYGSSTGVASDIADDKMVRPFFEQLFRRALQVLPKFGHAYVHCDWRSWAAIWEGAKRAGITCKNCLVWDKGGSGLGSNYSNTYELIGFFAKLPKTGAMTSKAEAGQRAILSPNVLRHNRPRGEDRRVNAAKPVELLAELVRNSSDEGGRVLDLFTGSGSTLIAAERAGRVGLGMEVEPATVDIILDRWNRLGLEPAILPGVGTVAEALTKRRKKGA